MAQAEKDAEISFLVSQLQKLQKDTSDLERASTQSQHLITQLHQQLKTTERELHKHNIPLPSLSSHTDYNRSPSPSHSTSHSIPTTPPIHPNSKPVPSHFQHNSSYSSISPPKSTSPSPHIYSNIEHNSPTPINQHSGFPTNRSPSPNPPMHYPHQTSASPPSNYYVLAQIPPNQPPSHTNPSPTPPSRPRSTSPSRAQSHSYPHSNPPISDKYELLEKENAKLREQCESLTTKLFKSQQLFVQKVCYKINYY